jgi:hypothetical protein
MYPRKDIGANRSLVLLVNRFEGSGVVRVARLARYPYVFEGWVVWFRLFCIRMLLNTVVKYPSRC